MALIGAPPAFLALGILGLVGQPHAWPWPFVTEAMTGPGASLESWQGLPLWIAWVWTTVPGAAVVVALAALGPVERLERSWEDAARLTGASPGRIARSLSWPIVRPSALRAAALVFLFALVEPGAPLILGLRRTLAYQIVDLAGRPDPFPRLAVWAIMAGLFGLAGWAALRWRAGSPIIGHPESAAAMSRNSRYPRTASPLRAVASTLLMATWALAGWLPVAGLIRIAVSPIRSQGDSSQGPLGALLELVRRIGEPPVPQLAANSLVFGIEVACAIMVLAWIVGPDQNVRPGRATWWRVIRPIAHPPPLILAVGFVALPWLGGLASRLLDDAGRPGPARVLEDLAAALDPYRNSWFAMICCVALTLAPRLFLSWRRAPGLGPLPKCSRSAYEAALVAGALRARAGWFSAPRRRGRWLGRFVLVWALAATNLTPALLFAPWTDGRTVAPGIVALAGGAGEEPAQAAALALLAVAVNVGALFLARLTSALPLSEAWGPGSQ